MKPSMISSRSIAIGDASQQDHASDHTQLKNFKRMKLILCLMASLLFFSSNIYAVKAIPEPVTVTQPDGSKLRIKIHGDEFFNYYTTEEGYTIAKGKDGFFYYTNYSTGKQVITPYKAGPRTKGSYGSRGVPQNIIDHYRNKAITELNNLLAGASARTKSTQDYPGKVLVILAQYSDLAFVTPNPQQAFYNMLNQAGYSENGATGSAADYYSDNSMGAYRPQFVVSNVVTLPKSYRYYGEKTSLESITSNAQEQTKDACTAASKMGINFNDFDSDNDGNVDIVLIYYAGHNAAEGAEDAVWPHRWVIPGNFMLDGKRIYNYACTSELKGGFGSNMAGIGTMCHEFGHTLGLPDLYDVDYNGSAALWGSLALMDGGNYNNKGRTPPFFTALERSLLGWLQPQEIASSGKYSLENVSKNKAYLIKTGNDGEYYLLENRQSSGWDKYISDGGVIVGGGKAPQGMMITHIDQSQNMVDGITAYQRWYQGTINTVRGHQCADLVEAGAVENPDRIPVSDVLFPGTKNVTAFTSRSIPSSNAWSGNPINRDITNIALNGEIITFDLTVVDIDTKKTQLSGTVKNFLSFPMENVTISLYEASAAQTIEKGKFQLVPVTKRGTKSTPAYTARTNAAGIFSLINIEPKTYLIEVKTNGYIDYSISKALAAGAQNLDIIMHPKADNPLLSYLKWHNGAISSAIGMGGGAPFYSAILFEPADLSNYQKNKISKVRLACNSAATIELTILSGNKSLVTKTITTNAPDANITFDLSADNIIKDNSKALRVQLKFANYDPANMAISIDASTAVNGKGNLVSGNGTTWESLKDGSGIDGNFLITVDLEEETSANQFVSNLKSTVSQHKAFFTWDSQLPNDTKWVVQWGKLTDATSRQTINARTIVLQQLEKNQLYTIQIGALSGTEETPSQWQTFTITTKNTSEQYPAILFTEQSYKTGNKLLLDIINLAAPVQTIAFTINGAPVTDDIYTFEKAGIYTIVAEIQYTGGATEKITRKINVTNL